MKKFIAKWLPRCFREGFALNSNHPLNNLVSLPMKLFLDTASPQDLEKALKLYPVDGVTTNPTLLSRQDQDPKSLIRTICSMISGPVSVQVTTTEADTMTEQGQRLYAIHPSQIVVKLPMTWDGLEACRRLRAKDIPVNMTLCSTLTQAILAAKAGATYVSLFLARLAQHMMLKAKEKGFDSGGEDFYVIRSLIEAYKFYGFKTQVLAASLRTLEHAHHAMAWYPDCLTLPLSVFEKLLDHPVTQEGVERFGKDWEGVDPSFKEAFHS